MDVFAGTTILEMGAGAAGPVATRYFADCGATVVRIESKARPDFLRTLKLTPNTPGGLDAAEHFAVLNVNKLSVALNLSMPEGVAVAKRLALRADAVAENFAPGAMKKWGLDYATLVRERPDLVMISTCLNGATGPHRNYPGFGGQGSALSGYNALTGWPDREPVGPHGTITDSLAPRFVAAALAAGLHYRRRTGRGVYLDVSQVETAVWSLAPWLLDYELDGVLRLRDGNRHPGAVLHGVYPCADEGDVGDRWVAVACWTGDEADRLSQIIGAPASDEVLAAWTAGRTRAEVAATLQAAGVEAVPVADFGDLHDDPQLTARGHFETHEHPYLGRGQYERNGFRLARHPSGYDRAGPTLGQDNDWVTRELLGLDDTELAALRESGALE
jgi:benzylsuccinate CoA-transferase BbsF subunit